MAVKDTLVSLGMTTVAAPVILVSLLIRRARSLTSEQGGQLPFKEDLHHFPPSFLSKRYAIISSHGPSIPSWSRTGSRLSRTSYASGYPAIHATGTGSAKDRQESFDRCKKATWFVFGSTEVPIVSVIPWGPPIFSVEYTLAPAATFPQQQCEATAAYRHLLEAEGISAERIIIAGDSAGGHLALSCLVALNKEASGEAQSNRDKDMISKRFLDRCVEAVIGERGRVEALNLEDLVNPWEPGTEQDWKEILPSFTWVNVGAHDVLLHDVQTFVQRAKAKGAQLELKITPSKPHRWNFDLDKESEDLYCKLRPDDQVPAGMMTGSSTIAEGLLTVLYGGN